MVAWPSRCPHTPPHSPPLRTAPSTSPLAPTCGGACWHAARSSPHTSTPNHSVLDVNEVQYSFTAQLRYTLTCALVPCTPSAYHMPIRTRWRDESAEESIANATRAQREAGEPCRRPWYERPAHPCKHTIATAQFQLQFPIGKPIRAAAAARQFGGLVRWFAC